MHAPLTSAVVLNGSGNLSIELTYIQSRISPTNGYKSIYTYTTYM